MQQLYIISFLHKSDLEKHLRTPTGEKSYHCNQCNKALAQKGDITIYLRIHTGEEPY